MSEEKTEAPTPRRRSEARRKGEVTKSMEVNTAFALLAAFAVLNATGKQSAGTLSTLFRRVFTKIGEAGTVDAFSIEAIRAGGLSLVFSMVQIVAPLILTMTAVGIVVNLAQTGLLFSTEALQFNFKRLDPINGLKRMFALRGVVELFKSAIKITIVGWVVYTAIRDNITTFAMASNMQLSVAIGRMVDMIITIGMRVGMVMLVIAAIDYFYQRHEHEKSMRMTKQELKQEMKEMENPELRARIKSRQRQIARQRMMAAVPTADVVITNPTHFAVALQYDKNKMFAPQVVAKGQELVAQRIKELAKEHNVPLVENKPLARTLFSDVEIGQPVPAELYKAVAEVLAFVYRLKAKKLQKRF